MQTGKQAWYFWPCATNLRSIAYERHISDIFVENLMWCFVKIDMSLGIMLAVEPIKM